MTFVNVGAALQSLKDTASPGSKQQSDSPPYVAPTAGSTTTPDPVTTTTTPTFPGVQAVLGGDPTYQGLLAFDTAASGSDLAKMNANIATMKAYYGSDSDPLSLLGRVFQAYQDRNRTIANTLTGHGMINSGETGFQGARATLSYQQQEYDAQFKLQQYIAGLQQAFDDAERQRKFNELMESQNAANRWIQGNQPSSQTTQPPDVTTPPTLGSGGTQIVYDENGNPIIVGSAETYNPFK